MKNKPDRFLQAATDLYRVGCSTNPLMTLNYSHYDGVLVLEFDSADDAWRLHNSLAKLFKTGKSVFK